jgi:hypothetical protein
MSDQFDLTGALREGGYGDLADRLERKQIADRLRESGRDDVADKLEAAPEPATPKDPALALAEQLRDHLNESVTKQFTIGAFGRRGGGAA